MIAPHLTDLPLFQTPVVAKRMARARDRQTAKDAAGRVLPHLSPLQQAVLQALTAAGADGLTDRELERLAGFQHLAPSTVRKRRSELFQLGKVREAGVRDRLTVWVVAADAAAVEAADDAP